jgi:hypothetical protein
MPKDVSKATEDTSKQIGLGESHLPLPKSKEQDWNELT